MAELPTGDRRRDRALARSIGRWFRDNARELPWRTDPRDPWLSLISEIMLQQTQATRVAERFNTFAERFPTPAAMASRPIDDVLALWSGLGYYRRARSLHACALAIVHNHEGVVPPDAKTLQELPGVGRYTAGAVASIAFGASEPLVDGNVSRVLLRIHGLERAADEAGVQAWAWRRAADLAEAAPDVPAYSEGIMELGATVCTPRAPGCERCPVRTHCAAHAEGAVERIPKPKSRAKRTPLSVTAFVVTDGAGRVLLEQRPSTGLWAGLWQPPCVERASATPVGKRAALESLGLSSSVQPSTRSSTFGFATTHRQVTVRVWPAVTGEPGLAHKTRAAQGPPVLRWFARNQLASLGFGSAQRRMLAAAGVAGFDP